MSMPMCVLVCVRKEERDVGRRCECTLGWVSERGREGVCERVGVGEFVWTTERVCLRVRACVCVHASECECVSASVCVRVKKEFNSSIHSAMFISLYFVLLYYIFYF